MFKRFESEEKTDKENDKKNKKEKEISISDYKIQPILVPQASWLAKKPWPPSNAGHSGGVVEIFSQVRSQWEWQISL